MHSNNTNVFFTKVTSVFFLIQYIHTKKITFFDFIIYPVNKLGVSRRWFTEADVKDFKSGTLRAIKNITRV